jgi:hypothetical protein
MTYRARASFAKSGADSRLLCEHLILTDVRLLIDRSVAQRTIQPYRFARRILARYPEAQMTESRVVQAIAEAAAEAGVAIDLTS